MIVGVAKETCPGERRVALVPGVIPSLAKAGVEVLIQSTAGQEAGYLDQQYLDKGAKIVATRPEIFQAEVVLAVRTAGLSTEAGQADLALLRPGQVLIGMADPLGTPQAAAELAAKGITLLALELLPRITRAQSMDVLSSQATIAGYRAVLLAALALPKLFPMMITAAGTLNAAKVLVVGAGVAGLQAIATARRLGAMVSAYDVRPAVKEQVQSLGAKFVEMPLDSAAAEGTGGYAQQMDEDFYRRQRELMTRVVAESDVVITTAAVPGKKAPVLVTGEMVSRMAPGSVIVDLAAERGGNCELTRAGQTVLHEGVTILGPLDLAAETPAHASLLYAKNISTFLLYLLKDGALNLDPNDELVRETLIARGGEVVHPRIKQLLDGPAKNLAAGLK